MSMCARARVWMGRKAPRSRYFRTYRSDVRSVVALSLSLACVLLVSRGVGFWSLFSVCGRRWEGRDGLPVVFSFLVWGVRFPDVQLPFGSLALALCRSFREGSLGPCVWLCSCRTAGPRRFPPQKKKLCLERSYNNDLTCWT